MNYKNNVKSTNEVASVNHRNCMRNTMTMCDEQFANRVLV